VQAYKGHHKGTRKLEKRRPAGHWEHGSWKKKKRKKRLKRNATDTGYALKLTGKPVAKTKQGASGDPKTKIPEGKTF